MQYDVIMCVTCEDIYPVVASLCHDHTILAILLNIAICMYVRSKC